MNKKDLTLVFTPEIIACLVAIRVKPGRLRDEWVEIHRGDGFRGTLWAVLDCGFVLNKDGVWEYEPMPSSRDDEFLDRCRFDTFEDAVKAALQCKVIGHEHTRQ